MPGADQRPAVPGLGGAPRGRCLVMGVLNVTPDSFSDGGRWDESVAAIFRGRELAAAGADLVDVGGESTRPGAQRVPADVELARVLPVVSALAADGIAVSIDTMRAEVAAAAVDAGAVLVNDVSGGLGDPGMLDQVAALDVAYVAMHWRAQSADMDAYAVYPGGPGGVVDAVLHELAERRDAALAAGIRADMLALDPGLGFAKTAEHNWQLLGALPALRGLGHPILVGASRKRFLGALLPGPDGDPRPVEEREDAGVALTALAAAGGSWAVRVHEPRPHRDAVAVAGAWEAGGRTEHHHHLSREDPRA